MAEWKKDVSRLNERRKGTFKFEKKDFDRIERMYKLSDVRNVHFINMLKEKISAGATKIRQYAEWELHYHQNTLFTTNQKQLSKVKKRLSEIEKQEDIRISAENVRTAI